MTNFFTTSEVARICGVAHTTVIRWIEEGKLKAHETPGGHRRIEKKELAGFLKQFKIPVPAFFGSSRFRILAVDDEAHVLSMIRRTFAKNPGEIEVQTTTNGMEALVALGKNHFDLLILDIVMPEMDGLQVCATIRQNPDLAGMKIIVTTGKQLSEEQEAYLKINAECVIEKPFSPSELMGEVRKLM